MEDSIRIDSHKLIFHPGRVSDWMQGKKIYPLEIEVGLSGACNHRCTFCAVDYLDYEPNLIDADMWIKELKSFGEKGLKSIIYAGEGEPLMHPRASEIINCTKKNGIDAAISTNAVLMTKEFSKDTLASLSWIRISIAGGTTKTYSHIHQCSETDFDFVLQNIEETVRIKKDRSLKTTLGAQLLLLPENKEEVVDLAQRLKKIGIDYFTIKPFSKHPQSKAQVEVDYDEMMYIEKQIEGIETDSFKIYFRKGAIENLKNVKPYDRCCGLDFMTYIDASATVYPCIVFMGDSQFQYGNLNDTPFDEIWNSERTKSIKKYFQGDKLKTECREACRLDEINKYLNELIDPGDHVNFI